MFWGNMTEKQINGLMDLVISTEEIHPSYLDNEKLLDNTILTWFQCFCVEHCFLSRGSIVSLGTGLGKTVTAMAYTVKILNKNPNKCGLFFCLPESVEQIYGDFIDNCSYPVGKVTGVASDINSLDSLSTADYSYILIVSYEALYSIKFANWFVKNMNKIEVTVFDEAHELSQKSLVNSFVQQICNRVNYRMALTATPITRSPEQVIRLLQLFDKTMIPGGISFLRPYEVRNSEFELVDYRELDNFSQEIYPRYVSWDRSELNLRGHYHPYVLEIEPTEEQRRCQLKDAYKVIKGDPNSKQASVFYALVNYLKSKNKIGLCYAYNREISEQLCQHLKQMGINAYVMNGDTHNKAIRQNVIDKFHQGQVDLVITNLTMSLNLACDYLIFWQFTNRAVQMLGRCERGFLVKDLDIYMLVTKDTVEVEQYQNNVYKRCKWLAESLGKDVEVFKKLSDSIGV